MFFVTASQRLIQPRQSQRPPRLSAAVPTTARPNVPSLRKRPLHTAITIMAKMAKRHGTPSAVYQTHPSHKRCNTITSSVLAAKNKAYFEPQKPLLVRAQVPSLPPDTHIVR